VRSLFPDQPPEKFKTHHETRRRTMASSAFKPEEIVILRHKDKRTQQSVESPHPKVGGRLRLCHEENDTVTIKTEIVRFEETAAVVKAETITKKGAFNGLGTASAARDERLADALLEVAESRAIARSLRFAGYGVEYCSAEEVSHVEGTIEEAPTAAENPGTGDQGQQAKDKGNGQPPADKGNGKPGNGNGNDRLTNAQMKAIQSLAKKKRLGHKGLNELTTQVFGINADVLSKDQASHIIKTLQQ
jgi:hypothetical protein